ARPATAGKAATRKAARRAASARGTAETVATTGITATITTMITMSTARRRSTDGEVLSHDRDRLRQQRPAPRDGVREDRGRRHRALQTARGLRHALPHGERRAFDQRREGGAGAGTRSRGVLRPHGDRLPRCLEEARHLLR